MRALSVAAASLLITVLATAAHADPAACVGKDAAIDLGAVTPASIGFCATNVDGKRSCWTFDLTAKTFAPAPLAPPAAAPPPIESAAASLAGRVVHTCDDGGKPCLDLTVTDDLMADELAVTWLPARVTVASATQDKLEPRLYVFDRSGAKKFTVGTWSHDGTKIVGYSTITDCGGPIDVEAAFGGGAVFARVYSADGKLLHEMNTVIDQCRPVGGGHWLLPEMELDQVYVIGGPVIDLAPLGKLPDGTISSGELVAGLAQLADRSWAILANPSPRSAAGEVIVLGGAKKAVRFAPRACP